MLQKAVLILAVILLVGQAGAAPATGPDAERIRQQIAAKDATIASLRRQLVLAQVHIQILQNRTPSEVERSYEVERSQSMITRPPDYLDGTVQNYNMEMHRAANDLKRREQDLKEVGQVTGGNNATARLGSDPSPNNASATLQDAKRCYDSMTQEVYQALVFHKQILASPAFASRYTEQERCLSPENLSNDLKAAGAADLRFIERK